MANYPDGRPIALGDLVALEGGMTGRVVALLDAGQFAEGYPAKEWDSLRQGLLVDTDQAGLIHYERPGVEWSPR